MTDNETPPSKAQFVIRLYSLSITYNRHVTRRQAIKLYALFFFIIELLNVSDREIQRTLMELLNQMDGFDVLGQVRTNLRFLLEKICSRDW